jgi:CRP-like cAMP-binding protein
MGKQFTGDIHFRLMDILRKIPVFRNLTVDQFTRILSICTKLPLRRHQPLCLEGEDSHELYVLLTGHLSVMGRDGEELSGIDPIGIVGEMGMFTGDKRSATVEATEDSIVLVIRKSDLMSLFAEDHNLAVQVMTNVIKDLSNKLANNNIIIEELRQVAHPETLTQVFKQIADDVRKTSHRP